MIEIKEENKDVVLRAVEIYYEVTVKIKEETLAELERLDKELVQMQIIMDALRNPLLLQEGVAKESPTLLGSNENACACRLKEIELKRTIIPLDEFIFKECAAFDLKNLPVFNINKTAYQINGTDSNGQIHITRKGYDGHIFADIKDLEYLKMHPDQLERTIRDIGVTKSYVLKGFLKDVDDLSGLCPPGEFTFKECDVFKWFSLPTYRAGKTLYHISGGKLHILREGYDGVYIWAERDQLKYIYDHPGEAKDIIERYRKATYSNKAIILRGFIREVDFSKIGTDEHRIVNEPCEKDSQIEKDEQIEPKDEQPQDEQTGLNDEQTEPKTEQTASQDEQADAAEIQIPIIPNAEKGIQKLHSLPNEAKKAEYKNRKQRVEEGLALGLDNEAIAKKFNLRIDTVEIIANAIKKSEWKNVKDGV